MKELLRYLRWFIAMTCAVGTGMLAVATVISTPTNLLLFLMGGLVVNYLAPPIYKRLSAYFFKKDRQKGTEGEDPYLEGVIKNTDTPLDKVNSKLTGNLSLNRTVVLGALTLSAVLAVAVGLYFLMSLVLLPLMPPSVLLYGLAAIMFVPICFLTFFNYNKGIKDVAEDTFKYLQSLMTTPPPTENPDQGSTPEQSSLWHRAKPWLLAFGVISCIAGGILSGAMIREGTITTFTSFIVDNVSGVGLGVITGPLGWVMFSVLLISTFSIMAYGLFNLFKPERDKENTQTWQSLTNPTAYCETLKAEWTQLNQEIKAGQAALAALKAKTPDDEQVKTLEAKLDVLNQQKDTVFHRYSMYQKRGFYPLFAVTTAVVFTLCSFGMLMHMARGAQSLDALLAPTFKIAERWSMGIASGLMWLSMAAEIVFTGTIVTSTLSEEAILGTQTAEYQDRIETQKQPSNYAYETSRGTHLFFETSLGLFGSSGESSPTGQPHIDNKVLSPVYSVGNGARALLERPDEVMDAEGSRLTFMYDSLGCPERPVPPENLPKRSLFGISST